MAIVTYPPGSPGLNKSKSGACFTANFSGSIIRSRVKGLTSKSPIATKRRTNYLHLVRSWASILASEKIAWNNAAAALPFTNSIGVTYYLSGFQYFCQLNQYRLNQSFNINPQYSAPPVFPSISITNVFWTVGPQFLLVQFSETPVPADFEYRILSSYQVSQGLTLSFPRDYKIIKTLAAGSASPTTMTTQWNDVYGPGYELPVFNAPPPAVWFVIEVFSIITSQSIASAPFKITVPT